MPRGNPAGVALGPGELFAAVLGSTEPVDHRALVFDSSPWTKLGYTQEGSTQSYSPSYENVEVAEELEPLDSVPTGREIGVSFQLAENTAGNYKLALNGGTLTVVAASVGPPSVQAHVKFEPPDLGTETSIMIGFRSEDKLESWVWRQCKNVGATETNRRKGAEKALIPVEFRVFRPTAGTKPFTRWSARAGEQTP